jgi:hypothetical protein
VIDTALETPNATGIWEFHGVDISRSSESWPDPNLDYVPGGNGWSFEMKTATNVTIQDGSIANPSAIYLHAPEDAFGLDSIDPSYSACVYVWDEGTRTEETLAAIEMDSDGLCSGVVSERCIEKIKGLSKELPCGRGAQRIMTPDECGDALGTRGSQGTFSLFSILTYIYMCVCVCNEANMYLWCSAFEAYTIQDLQDAADGETTKLYGQIFPFAHPGNESDIDLSYDTALTGWLPVLLTYQYEGEAYSVFRCLHTNNIEDGSREPEGYGIVYSMAVRGTAVSLAALAAALGASLMMVA